MQTHKSSVFGSKTHVNITGDGNQHKKMYKSNNTTQPNKNNTQTQQQNNPIAQNLMFIDMMPLL